MRWIKAHKYQHLFHRTGCACMRPEVQNVCARLERGIERRAFLGGLAALVAAPALGAISPAFAQAASRPLLLSNARIFDGVSSTLLEGLNILVEDGRIKAMPGVAETVADAEILDCSGKTLMPGLIDAHWHTLLAGISLTEAMTADIAYLHLVAAEEAQNTILRGFTTVRDAGGPSFALKRAIDENRIAGPRIFPSGAMISQTSGHGDFRGRRDLPRAFEMGLSDAERAGISALADGVPEVLRRTREQLMLGASQIKIMVGGGVSSLYDPLDSIQFTAPEVRAAVEAASDWGTYVCAHVYTPAGIRRALSNGVRCIEHGQLADEDAVRQMADTGAWWSIQPFLADDDSNPKSLPEQRAMQELIAEGTMRAFGLGRQFNIKMAWGTDILFNPAGTRTQGRQLAKTAQWLDNDGALRMATSGNGELLALSGGRAPYKGKIGVLAPMAYADILAIDGNPLDDISLISDPDKNMKLIMKDGRIYKNTLAG